MKSIIFLFLICCNSLICWAQGVHSNYLFPEFTDSYIYYKDGNYLKYYQDMTGIRTIAYDKEFEFNNSLHYYVYYSTK